MLLLRSVGVLLVILLVPSTIVAQATFTQIAISGGAAPGVAGVEHGSFDFPSINESGDVAFLASLTTEPQTEAIFGPTSGAGSPLGVIAITGGTAPGTGGETYDRFFRGEEPPALNASGDVAFSTDLANGECAVFGPMSGAGSALGLIAIANTLAPGATDGAEFAFLSPVSLNASGDTGFLAILQTGTGSPVNSTNNNSIVGPTAGAGSALRLVSREGEPAPGVGDGSEFDFIFVPAINASGDVAFRAGLRADTGDIDSSRNNAIFGPTSGAGSPLGLIAREGDAVPGAVDGAILASFFSPALSATGDVAFHADLRAEAGGSLGDAIFGPTSGAGSSLGLIAREGDSISGLVDGAEFRSFSLLPSINASGTTAFVGRLRGAGVNGSNDSGLFTFNAGQLECIVREGDQVTVTLPAGTEERTVSFINFSRTGLSDAGLLAVHLFFTDGSEGIFTVAGSKTVLLGDVNLDGIVNFLDISPFIMRLTTGVVQAEADINQDGIVNFLDIAPFIQVLTQS